MATTDLHILRESVDLLILKSLTWGPKHGYAVASWIEWATDTTLFLEEGTLYPALHRLARQRLVKAEWGASENNRRARFYELTKSGRARLVEKSPLWQRHVDAIGRALAINAAEAASGP
jgi:PadR family transcriptional regulator, regulatory protein PadR